MLKYMIVYIYFLNFGVFLTAPVSAFFFENQGHDLFRAKGVVILDTGLLFTSCPTDLKAEISTL
jgi:hypothetical protein